MYHFLSCSPLPRESAKNGVVAPVVRPRTTQGSWAIEAPGARWWIERKMSACRSSPVLPFPSAGMKPRRANPRHQQPPVARRNSCGSFHIHSNGRRRGDVVTLASPWSSVSTPSSSPTDYVETKSSSPAAAEAEARHQRIVTLLEFYSGMGTMRWSLEAALEALRDERAAANMNACTAASTIDENETVAQSTRSDTTETATGVNRTTATTMTTTQAHQTRQEASPSPSPSPTVIGVAAIDNSEVANVMYAANFPDDAPPLRTNIEHITLEQLNDNVPGGNRTHEPAAKNNPNAALGVAEVWTLSPPCQPYTRKGKELHGDDPRAASFLHLLGLFTHLDEHNLPRRVLVENVVGFERSGTRDELVKALESRGYAWREFQLSPHHLGVPYTRERYYLLAKRREEKRGGGGGGEGGGGSGGGGVDGVEDEYVLRFRDDAAPATATAGSDDYRGGGGGDIDGDVRNDGGNTYSSTSGGRWPTRRWTIGDYLEFAGGFGNRRSRNVRMTTAERGSGDGGRILTFDPLDRAAPDGDDGEELEELEEELASLAVPRKIVDKYWKWLEVCSPSSARCQCFTAGYGKTVYGGSVLASEEFVSAHCGPADPVTGRHRMLTQPPPGALELRYFSPREVANLHGLGESFQLPESTLTRRQLWFTLGNSISVDVVVALMKHLMHD